MALYFGNSSEIKEIYYNGTNLDKVYFNDVLVFEKKVLKTITESVYFPFRITGGQSGVTFYYLKSGIQGTLSHTPVSITTLGKNNQLVIATSGLGSLQGNAKFKQRDSSSSNYNPGTWSVSGKTVTLKGPDSAGSGSTDNRFAIDITYTYYE